jgi:hypothetical protein
MLSSVVTGVLVCVMVLYRHFTEQMIRHNIKQCQVFNIIYILSVLSFLVLMTAHVSGIHITSVKQIFRENSVNSEEVLQS